MIDKPFRSAAMTVFQMERADAPTETLLDFALLPPEEILDTLPRMEDETQELIRREGIAGTVNALLAEFSLRKKLLILARIEIPSHRPHVVGGSSTDWGATRSKWVAGHSAVEVHAKALTWADDPE